MHRSGTSAIARAVNLLGPYIGPREHLMRPVEGDNPHGFWEHWSIFSFHERLLSYLSSSWDSILPLPEDWWKQQEISPSREELRQIVKSEFAGQEFWMWKDPRTSLVLPLWKDVLQELDVDTQYIICVRNPLDVALSLQRRNNFSKRKSLSLWLLYTTSALFWTDGAKRILLNFYNLLENWEPSLRKVSTSFGIPWPQDDSVLRKSMTDFLCPSDRHSRSDAEMLLHDRDAGEPVKKVYRLLLQALEKDDVFDSEWFSGEIENIYHNYCGYAKIFTPLQKSGDGGSESWKNRIQKIKIGKDRVEGVCSERPCRAKTKQESAIPDEARQLVFPKFSNFQVSIIIPAWNHWKYTYRCLQSILANTGDTTYEVIIVDNGSSDQTGEMLAKVENVRVIRNESNAGYVVACNQGAEAARGVYLVFLNNDTEPLAGWLKELIDIADSDETVGAVGAKLIYPDGLLQEAGGMIFADGHGWNFGNGDDPYDEIYNVICEVDYCSGACLLVKKNLFAKLGGFDIRFSPAYYEDADMCFSLRRTGNKVVYNPKAEVVHHESVTSGVDKSSGVRSHYMETNRKKFVQKWETELFLQDASPVSTGRLPVTACRERLTRKDFSSENALLILHHKLTQRYYPATALTEKSILYKSLDEKEKKSLEVIRRADRLYGNEGICIEWVGDIGSTVVLHMARRTFEENIPLSVMRIATNHEPPELQQLAERLRNDWGVDLRHDSFGDASIGNVVDGSGLKALIGAQRWNGKEEFSTGIYFLPEERSRLVRVRPVFHFTELDLLQYIKKYHIPFSDIPTVDSERLLSEFMASISIEDVPPALRVSESFHSRVRLKNTSTALWHSKGWMNSKFAVTLGYHWIDKDERIIVFDGIRTPLIHDVGPNEEAVLYAEVVTPVLPGDYTLEFDLVQEGVAWFKDKGSETVKAMIHVESKENL